MKRETSPDTTYVGKNVGNRLEERAEEGIKPGELVSPLAFEGHKGGNLESPPPDAPEPFEPDDPLGLLPDDAEGRGKGQLGKINNDEL